MQKPLLIPDSESVLQERFNPFAWLVFHTFALWSSISYWLKWKRICAWHEPKAIRMGGNPFARRVTHGMCRQCFAKLSIELDSKPSYVAGVRPYIELSHGDSRADGSRPAVVSATDGPFLQAPSADLLGGHSVGKTSNH